MLVVNGFQLEEPLIKLKFSFVMKLTIIRAVIGLVIKEKLALWIVGCKYNIYSWWLGGRNSIATRFQSIEKRIGVRNLKEIVRLWQALRHWSKNLDNSIGSNGIKRC